MQGAASLQPLQYGHGFVQGPDGAMHAVAFPPGVPFATHGMLVALPSQEGLMLLGKRRSLHVHARLQTILFGLQHINTAGSDPPGMYDCYNANLSSH